MFDNSVTDRKYKFDIGGREQEQIFNISILGLKDSDNGIRRKTEIRC